MSIGEILQVIAAIVTALFGLIALFRPQMLADAAGLNAESVRGAAEIRASWGGLFLGLGLAALYLRTPDAYFVLGLSYGLTAVVRIVNLLLDRRVFHPVVLNILAFEIVSAVIFLLPGDLL